MNISDDGINFIKKWEGKNGKPVLKAYKDVKGVWTIGYGHTHGVHKGMQLENEQQAEDLLRNDLKKAINYSKNHVKVPLNQNQQDALISFVFNTGGLKNKDGSPTVFLKKLNSGNIDGAFNEELPRWIHSGGKKIQGLINRRNEEIELANKPVPVQSDPGIIASNDEKNYNFPAFGNF